MSRRPIFVTGSSRSGTTLVARMLGVDPDVHTLRELHFVEELWDPSQLEPLGREDQEHLAQVLLHRATRSYNLPEDRTPHVDTARSALDALGGGPVTRIDVLWAVLAHEAATTGATRPCEQTPRNAFYMQELLEQFPDGRVVAMVRDPRDVVLSMKNWWRRGRLGAHEQTWRTTLRKRVDYHPLVSALLWRSAARAVLAATDPRVLTVRFERVALEPSETLADICSHVGLEPTEGMLSVGRQNSSNFSDGSQTGTGIDPSVVGRGSTELSRTELWITQRLTRREMAALDYEPVVVRPSAVGLAMVVVTLVPKVSAAFVANVRRAKSPVQALRRRLSP